MKLLVVEDDELLQQGLALALTGEGYVCDCAATAAEASSLLITSQYSMVILDLGLPDMDGAALLRQWRRQQIDLPVLILTARDALEDRVDGLDAGADDYLSKPFGIGELLARVRVALRRHSANQQESPLVSFSAITVDLVNRRVLRNDEDLHLTPIEFRLLAELLANAGKVITQRQLLSHVWGPNYVEHSHYLRIYMGHLRQKLEADPARPKHLLTETGVGYRFMP
ncbi:response regulator [Serratia marcescens]|nr:response regulator [Serratia marcescens]RTF77793.1 response regulator [Serratia marcescens]RTF96588.1 response regulator [Serratia marcescens]RTG12326.1 response regulator [Serratia marcescens]RTG27645.1 response regulator [Serratia marcescens]RTG40884.1 response regulator [Serratia marcescens]